MPYRHYTSGSDTYFKNAKESWRIGFQAQLDEMFYDASSVYTIQEETSFNSGSWVYVDVRINQAIDRQTGVKLGNDFRTLLFKDLDHSSGLGRQYYFDDNTWVTTNIDEYKGLAKTSVIRRCNATLRWVDKNGNSFSEPCAIDYELNRARDEIGAKNPITPQGYVDVYCQLNDNTKLIKGNQRFLFGPVENRVAFQVFGNGVRNFLNEETGDDSSCALLVLTMGANYVNEDSDDVTNGIADYNRNLYTLSISPSAISADVGDIYELTHSILWNGDPVSKTMSYITSSSEVATVSGSGLVTMVASGSVTITGCMVDNIAVYDTSTVVVSGSTSTTYEVRVSPTSNLLLQGDTQTYSVYLYTDGVQQADAFVFTVADANVPVNRYTLTVLGDNSFSVENVKFYLENPLSITCTSGSQTKDVDIYLRGGW